MGRSQQRLLPQGVVTVSMAASGWDKGPLPPQVSVPWGTQAPQLEAGSQVRFFWECFSFGKPSSSLLSRKPEAMGEKKNFRGVGEPGVAF